MKKPSDAIADDSGQGFRIGFLLHDVSRTRKVLFDQEVRPYGITRSQWWVLAQLSREDPEGILQTELANILEVGKVTIGGILDRLELSGFVARRLDKADRRVKRVVITPQGRTLLKEIVRHARQLDSALYKDISADEIRAAEQFLSKMMDNIRRELSAKAARK